MSRFDEYRKAVKARCAKATKGPWKCNNRRHTIESGRADIISISHDYGCPLIDMSLGDVAFIANARTDVEMLLKIMDIVQEQADKHQLELIEALVSKEKP